VPKYMGSTFTWVSKFWIIVQKPARAGKAIYDGLDLTEAQTMFHELLKFSDELLDDVRRAESCPNHVLVLQYVSQRVSLAPLTILQHLVSHRHFRPLASLPRPTRLTPLIPVKRKLTRRSIQCFDTSAEETGVYIPTRL